MTPELVATLCQKLTQQRSPTAIDSAVAAAKKPTRPSAVLAAAEKMSTRPRGAPRHTPLTTPARSLARPTANATRPSAATPIPPKRVPKPETFSNGDLKGIGDEKLRGFGLCGPAQISGLLVFPLIFQPRGD